MSQKYVDYFNENATEDIDDILMVSKIASELLTDKMNLRFVNPETNKPDPRMLASIFSKIYEGILISLEKYEREYSDFELNICSRLLIGYTTSVSDEDEKEGNFMIYLRHLNNTKKLEDFDDPSLTPAERAVQWNQENIIDQKDTMKTISVQALKCLEEIDFKIADYELILPIFTFVYESLVGYLKTRRRENNDYEYEINFMNCFFIGVREAEDGVDDVYIRPTIDSKLRMKNDSLASSKYE